MILNQSTRRSIAACLALVWALVISASVYAGDMLALADYASGRMVAAAQSLREVALQ